MAWAEAERIRKSHSIDVRGVICRVFRIYVDQVALLIPTAAVVFLIAGVLSTVLRAVSAELGLLSVLVSTVATSLFTGIVVQLVADIQGGRRNPSVGQLLRTVAPVLGQLILVGFVAALVEGIGLVLLVFPGFILLTIWSVFAPVIVLERPAGIRALGRSRELVRGSGWRVFAVIFVLVILVGIVAEATALADRSAGIGVILLAQVLVDTIFFPISALAAAVLYFDLRLQAIGVPS
jgi:hypothetical protein